MTAQQCLEHPWLKESSPIDTTRLSILSFCDEPSAYSSNSTIVPDDDDTDIGSSSCSFQEVHDPTCFDDEDAVSAPETSPVLCSAEQVLSSGRTKHDAAAARVNLSVAGEDTFFAHLPISRRAGSLPFRWRVPPRREGSCDRTSDLGYGSDGVSEISSADSSSDRSSIISLDDSPMELAQTAMRRYSDTSLASERLWRRTWERFLPATVGTCAGLPVHLFRQETLPSASQLEGGTTKPWERICTGSLARAMEKFNSPPPSMASSAELSKSNLSLSSPVIKAAPLKVSEVRTRLLSGPARVSSKPLPVPMKAPLLHLDKTEIVKSRLVKFQAVHHPAGS